MREIFDDVKIVEFTQIAAGPLIGRYLSDFGAEVIHVESRTRPDPWRSYPPAKDGTPGLERGYGFAVYNTNKYGITLNLKHSKGPELAKKLVRWADVVIENFTPGTMSKFGLGYQDLRKVKEDIIMLSTCNLGQTGPHAKHPGLGTHLTNLCGFTYLTGWPDRPPYLLYGPYVDYISVCYATIALVSALEYKRRTGRGMYIDISQYESGLQFMTPAILEYTVNGRIVTRDGNHSPCAAPHGVFPCKKKDTWVAIAIFSEEEWEKLCRLMGMENLASRFKAFEERKKHEEYIEEIISKWTVKFNPKEIEALLQENGIEGVAVEDMKDLFEDPQLSLYMWENFKHPVIEDYVVQKIGFELSEETTKLKRPGHLLGEHNEFVWTELVGLAKEEFEQYKNIGVFD
jgi:crotonobetainyl-CoA:carnitine CoA-transferase CaiB-like acyl-CoA transferase